jgi:hypothetical protein
LYELSKPGATMSTSPQSTEEPEFESTQPVGWLDGPHGAFRANPSVRVEGPQSLKWSLPVYLAQPESTQPPKRIAWVHVVDGKREVIWEDVSWFGLENGAGLYVLPAAIDAAMQGEQK